MFAYSYPVCRSLVTPAAENPGEHVGFPMERSPGKRKIRNRVLTFLVFMKFYTFLSNDL